MGALQNDPWRISELTFRPAGPEDLHQVVEVLSEAAAWAKARGVEAWWPVPFPEKWVRPGVERGEVILAEIRSQLVGTLTLTREDPVMWGKQPPIAAYVHRVAVSREYAHRGVGGRLLDWAADRARSWGRSNLRLDCLATNEPLVAYYRSQGFREVGRVQGNIPGEERPSVLMERPLPSIRDRRRRAEQRCLPPAG
jgi:protein-tyrosine phosphatase